MDLHLDEITLVYPDGDATLTAVDAVSVHVPAGTTTALLGPSGSGKSSLLAVAGGLTPPTAGVVRIAGAIVFTASTRPAEATRVRRRQIGVVFQQPQLLPSLTALEQVELQGRLRGLPRASLRSDAADLLDAVGLSNLGQRRPAQLSGGQRQRVAIARALVGAPDVLLVDEPTSALDHERGTQIVELLTSLARQRGTATLIVSHDASTLASVDDRVELRDGRLDRTAAVAVGQPITPREGSSCTPRR